MFVSDNSIGAIRDYFKHQLEHQFSSSEIQLMFKNIAAQRFQLDHRKFLLTSDLRCSESDLLFFRAVVKRLLNHEPFQYIIGSTEFFGLEILTDKRALIPRPETEELVEWICTSFQKNEFPQTIFDLCTGSGCIALSLKSVFKDASVFACDVSIDALNLTDKNESNLKLNLNKFHLDLLSNDQVMEQLKVLPKMDVMVSNPPYIPHKELETMALNVLEFEPHVALFVPNDDVLLFYRIIAKMAQYLLNKNAYLYFETHENLNEKVEDMLFKMGFAEIEQKVDLQGKARMIRAKFIG